MRKLSLTPKGKKGNAGNELLGWVILFGLIGLIGAIMGLIQTEVETDVVAENTKSLSTTQNLEEVTNTTATSLTECAAKQSSAITSLSAINATGGETILSGNYTYTGCDLTAEDDSGYIGETWNISYSFSYVESSWAYNNSQKAQEAQGKIFGKLPLVGTIVVLSLVLILVLGVVAYFRRGNATQIG
jgi:hypothetical protein